MELKSEQSFSQRKQVKLYLFSYIIQFQNVKENII